MSEKKILLVTFSDNADHQDATFGLYEQLSKKAETYLLAIATPKVPVQRSDCTWLVNCPKRPGFSRGMFRISLLFRIIRKIKKEHFDLIYFESLHIWNLPIMMQCKNKTLIWHTIHDVVPHDGDRQVGMVDIMNRFICRLADIVILRNQTSHTVLEERYGIPQERIRYLELWRRYPAFTEPVYSGQILFFGRINAYKGADDLLEITEKCPDIQFSVIGRVDDQMKETAGELKRKPNVYLNDNYVSDEEMKQAFIRADWVILPYHSATQSGVVVDAYKYSRPVIAFDVGAISEQVEDGCSGYLVKVHDSDAFVETLQKAIKLPKNIYYDMCRKAYDYGVQKYSVVGAADKFLSLLDQIQK